MITRIFKNAVARATMEGDAPKEISGVGAVVGVITDLGYCEEEIAPGAFDGADLTDVLVCFNHNLSKIMGRNSADTATISIDANGNLTYVANKLDLDNQEVFSAVRYIQRGEVDKASFMFDIEEAVWHDSEKYGSYGKRTITKISKVYEVGPVTLPAYDDTTSYAREKDSVMQSRSKFMETIEPTTDEMEEAWRDYYKFII